MAQVYYMSQEGLDALKKELEEKIAQRPIIAAAIAEAREKGDLSENAEYDAARDAQGLLELRISTLREKIAGAKVVDSSKLSTDKVSILTTVKFRNVANKFEMKYTIVGDSEADFSKGKLSVNTPIAKALLGHKVGEIVEAKVPQGIMKLEILEISI